MGRSQASCPNTNCRSTILEDCTCAQQAAWVDTLPDYVVAAVIDLLQAGRHRRHLATVRLVCRHWRDLVDHTLTALQPNPLATDAQLVQLLPKFPAVTTLVLSGSRYATGRTLRALSSKLKSLNLERCFSIEGSHLSALSSLTQLTALDLNPTQCVTSDSLSALRSLTNLRYLAAASHPRASLSDACLKSLQALTALRFLELSCWGITDPGLWALTAFSHLTSLALIGCTSIKGAGLAALQPLTSLTSLNINGCWEMQDIGLFAIAGLKWLTALDISANRRLTAVGISTLSALMSLKYLNMSGCHNVSDLSLRIALPSLKNLVWLHVGDCHNVTDASLPLLASLPTLTHLNISMCRYTEQGLTALSSLNSLRTLVLGEDLQFLTPKFSNSYLHAVSQVDSESIPSFADDV